LVKVLGDAQIKEFVENGYVVLPDAVPVSLTEELEAVFWSRLKATDAPLPWPKPMLHLQEAFCGRPFADAYTPRLTGAIDDLLGRDRWQPIDWLGWWLATIPGFDTPPWRAPEVGWHVDGLYDLADDLEALGLPPDTRIRGRRRRPADYRYRIHGKEQGVVLLFMITDMPPGTGTAVVSGSHRVTCHHLRQAGPAGLAPTDLQALLTMDLPTDGLAEPGAYERQILRAQHKRPIPGGHRGVLPPGMRKQVVEVCGNRGDVVLFHPFTLHATSANTREQVRVISNPWIELRSDARLDAADPTPFESTLIA
jgi:Phytanoyl-CoA dioxygenase (PhyH)